MMNMTNTETIPMVFLESLGDYVYMYRDLAGNPKYTGKGRGNRCLSHINSKGYDINDLWIVACNLERFRLDEKDASFVLESYLISTLQPTDNAVAGHYKECFIMSKFSEIFGTWKEDQIDNLESLPSWYTDNYGFIKGRSGKLTITATSTVFESVTRNGVQVGWTTMPNGDVNEITFMLGKSEFKKNLEAWAKELGLQDLENVGSGDRKDRRFTASVSDANQALDIFKDLFEIND
jgi:hypothetical protein|tara:strand:+ start:5774 stop:6478 length:705 start_codon:yes stop_codon:yes gene_type:complete